MWFIIRFQSFGEFGYSAWHGLFHFVQLKLIKSSSPKLCTTPGKRTIQPRLNCSLAWGGT